VPTVVAKWRELTYTILVDMFSVHQDQHRDEPVGQLCTYSGLQPYVQGLAGRVRFASTTKSFLVAHYHHPKVSESSEESICVNNGLNYSLYDSKRSRWTKQLWNRCDIREKCTLRLPDLPYRVLQYAVGDTEHSSNEVIARQTECPKDISLHEHYAFGTLRAGHRLQWRNMARELVTRILNFSRSATYTLYAQAAWQVGPLGDGGVSRESHADLEEEEFGTALLNALTEYTETAEGNWQGANALRTFAICTTRLLSITLSETIRDGCFELLQRLRTVSLRWLREIDEHLQAASRDEDRAILTKRTFEMALTCYGTFDVDPHDLSRLLAMPENVASLTECSIIVHDRRPANESDTSAETRAMLERCWRLAHLVEVPLRERITMDRVGLDRTVRQLWAGYEPGLSWTALDSPNQRWLTTTTSAQGTHSSVVHYNLLDGRLLVNGAALSRLPSTYESHPTFRRLFGKVSRLWSYRRCNWEN
jgi:hypothetical protein